MATRNLHNGFSPEVVSNWRKTSYYSHCQAQKWTPAAKESRSHCRQLATRPAVSRPCGTSTNSVQAGPHSPCSSPAPWGMAQEVKHTHENIWSSTCGNFWDSWESGEHPQDSRSERDHQCWPRQRAWPITKSNYSADGHQTRTKPIWTTTPNKSSKLLATSKTHQNTPRNTPSTSFGGCCRSGQSPGGATATVAASAPHRGHLCFTRRLLFLFWSDFVTVLAWEWICI